MKYEIVTLAAKTVVGVGAVTGNGDPDRNTIISELWQKLYQGGVAAAINNKVNTYAIGLYSDYAGDRYTLTVGSEVAKAQNPGLAIKTIPAGRYAKFSVQGHMVHAVAQAWQEIWQTPLDKSFTGDFEEYQNNEIEQCNINIYVALQKQGDAMDYEKEFERMMATQTEMALATVADGGPNVRIVNFYYEPQNKTLYFSTFADNNKVAELEQNPHVAFTTLPPSGQGHIRVTQGLAKKSAVPIEKHQEKFLAKLPGHIIGIPALLPELAVYEVTFERADVVLDVEHIGEVML